MRVEGKKRRKGKTENLFKMPTFLEHFYRKKEGQSPAIRPTPLTPSEPSQGQVSKMVGLYRLIRGMAGGPELEKLKADFESQWDKLAEDKREILVEKLLEMQLLPEIIGKALKIFKGKMIRLV